MESVIVPSSVTSIGGHAFQGTPWRDIAADENGFLIVNQILLESLSMDSVVIPDGVTSIADYVFHFAESLKEITIPDSVTSIGDHAFCYCQFTKLILPKNLTYIGNWAFYGTSIEEINIPESVTYIGELAFFGCSDAKKLVLPRKDTFIGQRAFKNCINLEEIRIPEGSEIQFETFYGCTNLSKAEIPEGVTGIGERAFFDTGLTSITIPSSVNTIEDMAIGYIAGESENDEITGIRVDGFTIFGSKGSQAEIYARENEMGFSELAATGGIELVIVPEKSNDTYVQGSGKDLVIYCTGEFSKFVSVEMDGVLVDASNYKVEEGPTVLTFSASYLDTLSVGKHTVTINFVDASIKTNITILGKNDSIGGNDTTAGNKESGNSANGSTIKNSVKNNSFVHTGDNTNVMLWIMMSIISVAICGTVFVLRKRLE